MEGVGVEKAWRECGECEGEGRIENECFEDTCCCVDTLEHGDKVCGECKGKGGWWVATQDILEFGE